MEPEGLTSAVERKRDYILMTFAVFMVMAVLGLADNLKGTLLPRIQDEFLLTELNLGLILAMNAAGYLTACTFTTALARKIGIKNCLAAGCLLVISSGIFVYFSPGFPALVCAFFIMNVGFGMLDLSAAVIAAKIFIKRTATMMNLTQFFYGVFATLSPVVSTGLLATRFGDVTFGWRNTYMILLCFAFVPAIPALIGRMKKQSGEKSGPGYFIVFKKPAFWLLTLILAFGVSCEVGMASWQVNFLEKAWSFTGEQAAYRLSLYFICFTAARLALGPLVDRIGLITSLAASTGLAGTAIVAGVLAGQTGTLLLIVAGIGVALIFPTVIAVIPKLFPDVIDEAITVILTCMGIAVVPANFLIGGIIDFTRELLAAYPDEESIRIAYCAGFLVVGLCSICSFAFTLILRARQKKAGRLV